MCATCKSNWKPHHRESVIRLISRNARIDVAWLLASDSGGSPMEEEGDSPWCAPRGRALKRWMEVTKRQVLVYSKYKCHKGLWPLWWCPREWTLLYITDHWRQVRWPARFSLYPLLLVFVSSLNQPHLLLLGFHQAWHNGICVLSISLF